MSGDKDSCAFTVQNGAALNLILAKNSDNNLSSGENCAGLAVPEGAALTIDGSGALSTSTKNGAGIGGGYVFPTSSSSSIGTSISTSGDITITGGIVTASSENGAGIGGGFARAKQL